MDYGPILSYSNQINREMFTKFINALLDSPEIFYREVLMQKFTDVGWIFIDLWRRENLPKS